MYCFTHDMSPSNYQRSIQRSVGSKYTYITSQQTSGHTCKQFHKVHMIIKKEGH